MHRKKFIENDTIYLSEPIESDYKIIFDLWNQDDTVLGYNWKIPYSFDEYCEQYRNHNNWEAIIIRFEDEKIIGRIGLSDGLPDMTITILKSYRGQGYGTMAFLLSIQYCFEVLKLDRIYSGCYEDNISSRKMIEKCGFKSHPDGNIIEPHIFSGEDRLQLDFIIENPLI